MGDVNRGKPDLQRDCSMFPYNLVFIALVIYPILTYDLRFFIVNVFVTIFEIFK